jgi:hypothetical protein
VTNTLAPGARIGAYVVAADGSLVAVEVDRNRAPASYGGTRAYALTKRLMRSDLLPAADVLTLRAGPDALLGRVHVLPRATRRAPLPCYVGRFHVADDGSRVVTDWRGPIALTKYGRARRVRPVVATKRGQTRTVARKATRPTNYAAERVLAGYIGWLD